MFGKKSLIVPITFGKTQEKSEAEAVLHDLVFPV